MDQTATGRRAAARGLPILSAPRRLAAYLVAVELLVVGLVAWRISVADVASVDLWTAGLLAVIAIGFEEGSSRLARLQIRLSSPMRTDMTSVWAVAAAVALPALGAALLMTAISLYVWFRQQRPAGEDLYRKLFVAATIIGGSVMAGAAAGATADHLGDSNGLVPQYAVAVVVAIVAYGAFNRVLVTIGLLISSVPLRQLGGSRHDNLVEFATLCLGGLVALAVLYEPWLSILVLAPMVSLQRGALVRDLEAAAITDAKTGLLNAVAWEQLAQRELVRAARVGGSLAVMIIDIDRFKGVNDRFGHIVGDQVLAGVAHAIRDSLREYDGPGRFGGEEFVAVLPDAGEREALVIAERVRLRVNELTVGGIVSGVRVTAGTDDIVADAMAALSVSIGVAVLDRAGTELTEMLHAADQALYRAKWNGRNQVQLARQGDERPEIVSV